MRVCYGGLGLSGKWASSSVSCFMTDEAQLANQSTEKDPGGPPSWSLLTGSSMASQMSVPHKEPEGSLVTQWDLIELTQT